MELSKQEMELFFLFPDLWSKNFFYKMFLNFIKEFKAGLKTGNGIFQTGIWIISPIFLPLIKNILLQNGSNFIREAARRNNEKRNSSSVLTRNVFPIIGDMTMTMTAGITQMRRIVQALHVRQGLSSGVTGQCISSKWRCEEVVILFQLVFTSII